MSDNLITGWCRTMSTICSHGLKPYKLDHLQHGDIKLWLTVQDISRYSGFSMFPSQHKRLLAPTSSLLTKFIKHLFVCHVDFNITRGHGHQPRIEKRWYPIWMYFVESRSADILKGWLACVLRVPRANTQQHDKKCNAMRTCSKHPHVGQTWIKTFGVAVCSSQAREKREKLTPNSPNWNYRLQVGACRPRLPKYMRSTFPGEVFPPCLLRGLVVLSHTADERNI